MIPIYSYTNLPYDLSGSLAKNRFRVELLWGLVKMLELHKKNVNYVMVFDYVCDIEAHLDGNNYEFYQLKTQNTGEPYSYTNFYYKGKKKNSILGKLYLLKMDKDKNLYSDIKISLVSNAPLFDGEKNYPNIEVLELSDIVDDAKIKIMSKINEELEINLENLSNSFFQKTDISLLEPSATLIGKLSRFYEDYFGNEAHGINALYRTIVSLISEKACYEYELGNDYNKILKYKSISKDDFENLLQKRTKYTSKKYVENAQEYIKNISNTFAEKIKLQKGLKIALDLLNKSKEYQKMEKEIFQFLDNDLDKLPPTEKEVISLLYDKFLSLKTIEIQDLEFLSLIILIFCRYEEDKC